ncbi:hypothetical protein ACFO1B_45040 [Dactylosporangium siamense]|uniref:Uncharacterized protein n=1 Tax=Dactylosporangium siamense TaxID=685454 RepID=A0A919UI42_9ACTN|nr:hypothetical protein [Dactylosporangium siamense]GIG51328.1 hypothetical protein Dsi01nite_093690 [Dactylosporangium siamense]
MVVRERQRHRTTRWAGLGPAAALFTATVAQGPAGGFVYDAARYFNGSLALFTDAGVAREGDLDFRGALTPVVYAPAALAEHLVGGAGRYAVLVENAVLVAVIGAVLLPGLGPGLAGRRGPAAGWLCAVPTWLCAVLTWLVAARFAPFPLMDLPAAAAFLTAARLALGDRTRWALPAAGVAAGVTLNLRPAYLLPLAVLGGLLAVTRRWPAAWFAAGVLAGSLPQLAVNLARGLSLSLTPPGTAGLAGFQAGYASYVVRYDTVTTGGPPQQFYCDPSLAGAVAGHPVHSTGGLVGALAGNLPGSVLFLLEKVAAALAWSFSTPYSTAATAERYELAVPVVLIVAAGIGALCRTPGARALAVLAAGVCASLMTSATETRFALPLVLLGVAGCALLAPPAWDTGRRVPLRFAATVLVAAAVLGAVAAAGLAHPLPPGPATAAACAANG